MTKANTRIVPRVDPTREHHCDRLRRFWKLTGLQKTEFSENLGRSIGWLSNILNKDRNGNYKRFVTLPNAKLIESVYGLDAEWLMKGSVVGADPVMKDILPTCGKMYTKFREDRLRKIGMEKPTTFYKPVPEPAPAKTPAEQEQWAAKEKQTAERNEQDRISAAKVAIERLKKQEAEQKAAEQLKKQQEAEQLRKFKEEQAQKKKQEAEQLVVKKPASLSSTQLSFADFQPVAQHPMNGWWYLAYCSDPNNTRAYGVDMPKGETYYIGRIIEVCPGGQFAVLDELIWPTPSPKHKSLGLYAGRVRRKCRSMGFFTDYHTGDVRRELLFYDPEDFYHWENGVISATDGNLSQLAGLFE